MGFEVTLIERYKRMAFLMDEVDKTPEMSREHLMEAALIGCNALKDLSVDNPVSDFRQAINLLIEARRQNSTEFFNITQTFGHFSSFLTVELRVIIAGGFPEYLANQIVQWCYDSYEELRRGGSDPAILLEKVKLFSKHACELADELKSNVEQDEEGQNTKKQIRVILKVMAGAALVGLNAAAAAAITTATVASTAALTAGGAAVSGAIGLSIINGAKWPAKVRTAGTS
jgi:hypothetical protein